MHKKGGIGTLSLLAAVKIFITVSFGCSELTEHILLMRNACKGIFLDARLQIVSTCIVFIVVEILLFLFIIPEILVAVEPLTLENTVRCDDGQFYPRSILVRTNKRTSHVDNPTLICQWIQIM